jgi:predicted permease
MDLQEAERAARLKFGSVDSFKESYRDQRGLPWVEGLLADLRFALRGMRKAPAFAAVAVLTLALWIGAITAVFSLVDQVLLRLPGISNPEYVVAFRTSYAKLNLTIPIVSARLLVDLHENSQVFDRAALMAPMDLNYTGGEDPQRLHGAAVTVEWFDVFGAKPIMGRLFRKDEDQPNANHEVVLSYGTWVNLFGVERSALGRTMEMNQIPFRIVGVMPPAFRWPRDADLWVPAGLPADAFLERARFAAESFTGIARTQPNVAFSSAQQWLRLHTDRIRTGNGLEGAVARNYQWSVSAVPFAETFAGETKKPLLTLLGAVAFVLLIICSNIAGLLVARASVRAQELAIRSALGATRGQFVRSFWAESLLLSFAGGTAGWVVAHAGTKLLLRLAPSDLSAGLRPNMDVRMLLFCALVALIAAALCGIAPAWLISRSDLGGRLKADGRVLASGPVLQRIRSGLVVAEAALAAMLLLTAGLFLRSFEHLQFVRPGLEPQGVMTAAFWLPQQSYPTKQQQAVFYATVLDELNRTPEVLATALGNPIPFSGYNDSGAFQIVGRTRSAGEPLPFGDERLVTPVTSKRSASLSEVGGRSPGMTCRRMSA